MFVYFLHDLSDLKYTQIWNLPSLVAIIRRCSMNRERYLSSHLPFVKEVTNKSMPSKSGYLSQNSDSGHMHTRPSRRVVWLQVYPSIIWFASISAEDKVFERVRRWNTLLRRRANRWVRCMFFFGLCTRLSHITQVFWTNFATATTHLPSEHQNLNPSLSMRSLMLWVYQMKRDFPTIRLKGSGQTVNLAVRISSLNA